MIRLIRSLIDRFLGTAEHSQPAPAPDSPILRVPVSDTRSPRPQLVAYDENLLERSRVQWQFGDWLSLAKLTRDHIEHHPDRAKLALLVAAANLQLGEASAARQFTRLAKDWGCSKRLLTQILVAGVHNSLGRAAAVSGQQPRAFEHFEAAVGLGTPGGDSRLLLQARAMLQLEQLGVGSSAPVFERSAEVVEAPKSVQAPVEIYSATAHSYYRELNDAPSDLITPFILLDSKSLPRSGLHYLKNTLSNLLEENFSFCEWYQEPGCCKKMPCAVTGYASHCQKTGTARLRLTKSHDFELRDPDFPPLPNVRRVVLVREPLYLLTSWFALDQLTDYRVALESANIKLEKIWISHEPEVLAAAYRIVDQSYRRPAPGDLDKWLSEKIEYVIGFMNKWCRPALENPAPHVHIVRYEDTNAFILDTLNELKPHLPPKACERIDNFCQTSADRFIRRQDPFTSPSNALSSYMAEHRQAFEQAADKIRAADTHGVLQ